MTITPEQLAMMREDATDGLDTGGQGTELLATHVMVLATEVERLYALEVVAHRHHHACLGACGCSVCDWIVAERKAKQ